ncbi:hypothetical protein PR202_ga11121 [Eleusine coracana subsp. coracana]|uniref:F-box domain-containing protein n=1 Tax=Eleusine coracana subsp. coracana TaxID=191504 RepID=A0AAV5C8J5_ELECO|nr:hypothetical protein PR202_ga11121 [Eleusine coracana subsp. coracana]
MPPPPPELSDDLVGETLLRLPPDDPACLLRASLVCKRWRRILADPAFRRRHRALYRAPSVVGFIRIVKGGNPFASRFVPNDPASGRPAARELPGWLPLDCRHGRALFLSSSPSLGTAPNYDFIVWDPLTNEQRHLPRPSPPPAQYGCNAAVLCAAATEGCDHRACHKGPFFVVFVWSHSTDFLLSQVTLTSARVYSSVSGDWSEPISVQHSHASLDTPASFPSSLVGDKLYFNCLQRYSFEYVLGVQSLSIIEQPPPSSLHKCMLFPHMSMEDGRLGCVDVEDEPKLCLRLWWRVTAAEGDGVACWERGRAIELETLLPDGALPIHPLASVRSSKPNASVLGFAEGTDVIFLGTNMRDHTCAVYMIHLNSGRARKVFDKGTIVVPYTSFCIPAFED